MSRSSLPVRAARQLQHMPLGWLRLLERPLLQPCPGGGQGRGMLILLALPRSGSTLCYQLLCHGLDVQYLSNLGQLLHQLPVLGGRLSRRLCAGHHSDFRSQQGFVPGLCGPAEGLHFWRYWCGMGLCDSENAADAAQEGHRSRHVQRAFAALAGPRQPLVTGYLGHVLAWERVRELFPHALFVRLHRDPVATALSILRCRSGCADTWFSTLPRECLGSSQLSAHWQVAAQVYWLNRRLAPLDGDAHCFHVHYESLCASPAGELAQLRNWAGERGLELPWGRTLPESFARSPGLGHDAADAVLIQQALEELQARHGRMVADGSANRSE